MDSEPNVILTGFGDFTLHRTWWGVEEPQLQIRVMALGTDEPQRGYFIHDRAQILDELADAIRASTPVYIPPAWIHWDT